MIRYKGVAAEALERHLYMMQLANLSMPIVRELMLAEVEIDAGREELYLSPRLSAAGRERYQALLEDAIRVGSPATLAASLGNAGILNATEVRQTKKGPVTARVPITAPETLAEGEFNRFYARAVARRALEVGQETVEVYRAKPVEAPRPESVAKVGALVSAEQLLTDLRTHVGVDTALGIPAGPNSGLSVRLARAG